MSGTEDAAGQRPWKIAGGCPAEGGTDAPYKGFCPQPPVLSCPMRWISVPGQPCALASAHGDLGVAVLDHPVFLGGDNIVRVGSG